MAGAILVLVAEHLCGHGSHAVASIGQTPPPPPHAGTTDVETPDADPTPSPTLRLAESVAWSSTARRQLIRALVMDFSIAIHSVIIGIALGVNNTYSRVAVLLVAYVFHQLFEGIGLGVTIALTEFGKPVKVLLSLLFCVTTPLGIAIGLGIQSAYSEDAVSGMYARGILNAIASGNLIYVSLVEMLAEDFAAKEIRHRRGLRSVMLIGVCVGAGALAIIAIWA